MATVLGPLRTICAAICANVVAADRAVARRQHRRVKGFAYCSFRDAHPADCTRTQARIPQGSQHLRQIFAQKAELNIMRPTKAANIIKETTSS